MPSRRGNLETVSTRARKRRSSSNDLRWSVLPSSVFDDMKQARPESADPEFWLSGKNLKGRRAAAASSTGTRTWSMRKQSFRQSLSKSKNVNLNMAWAPVTPGSGSNLKQSTCDKAENTQVKEYLKLNLQQFRGLERPEESAQAKAWRKLGWSAEHIVAHLGMFRLLCKVLRLRDMIAIRTFRNLSGAQPGSDDNVWNQEMTWRASHNQTTGGDHGTGLDEGEGMDWYTHPEHHDDLDPDDRHNGNTGAQDAGAASDELPMRCSDGNAESEAQTRAQVRCSAGCALADKQGRTPLHIAASEVCLSLKEIPLLDRDTLGDLLSASLVCACLQLAHCTG
eukprot:3160335-Rhodomonas_salina.1